MNHFLLIVITLFFVACSSPDRKINSIEIQNTTDSISKEKNSTQSLDQYFLNITGDSVEIPEFNILIKLSDRAENKINKDHESIIVMAFFTGRPIDTIPQKYQDQLDKDGGLFLCSYPIELTDKRVAIFKGIKFHKDLYYLLTDRDIELLINVYSGRRSGPNNILDCDILQDKMSNVAGKSFELNGKLIEEE